MSKLILAIATFAFCIIKCNSELPATDKEIIEITEKMFKKADMSLARVKFNDKPTLETSIFDVNDEDLNRVKTVKTMQALFDIYEIDAGKKPKPMTYETMYDIDNFINAVLDTDVMKILMKFLKEKKVVDGSRQSQFYYLRNLWFTTYARMQGGPKGSCGFKHVFCEDIIHKDNQEEISGLHNWIYFRHATKSNKNPVQFGSLTKHPLTLLQNMKIIKYNFKSGGKVKPANSMFVGTTPELEMALYTLCIAMHKEECKVSLDGKSFTIKTFAFDRSEGQVVASSYPII